MSGARAVVECLKAEGVEFVFGVPGGQTLSIMDVLYETPEIRFITTRDERGAAHMADAYGRITGTPGICLATTGPGATNLITGIGGAMRDSSPVIAITVNNRRKDIGYDDAQDADHVALFQSLTKWSVLVTAPERIPHVMREAFRRALAGCPGPVLVDFSRDTVEDGELEFTPAAPLTYRATGRVRPDLEDVVRAARGLREARRPVLWVGNGVLISEASAEVLALAEAQQIPVITTFNGIGAVPTVHPLVFGPRSRFGTRLTKEILAEADLLIAVGNSLNAPSTSRWTVKLPARIIQVDIEPTMVGRHYPCEATMVGDAREALLALASAMKSAPIPAQRTEWVADLQRRRTAWRAEATPAHFAGKIPIKPQYLVQRVRAMLPESGIIVAGAGNPGIWSHLMDVYEPRTYLKPVGFGNMGIEVPAAIAAKLARPTRHVVTIVGDGALGMCVAELETAVRERTPLVVVVMNNRSYGNIKQEHEAKYGPRYIGVDFGDVRFDLVAQGFGARGERVERPEDLDDALRRAFAAEAVVGLDVPIDDQENVWKDPF